MQHLLNRPNLSYVSSPLSTGNWLNKRPPPSCFVVSRSRSMHACRLGIAYRAEWSGEGAPKQRRLGCVRVPANCVTWTIGQRLRGPNLSIPRLPSISLENFVIYRGAQNPWVKGPVRSVLEFALPPFSPPLWWTFQNKTGTEPLTQGFCSALY